MPGGGAGGAAEGLPARTSPAGENRLGEVHAQMYVYCRGGREGGREEERKGECMVDGGLAPCLLLMPCYTLVVVSALRNILSNL